MTDANPPSSNLPHAPAPMTDRALGYALAFAVSPGAGFFGGDVADAILSALSSSKFSGRVEYYAAETWPGLYVVGLGLKPSHPRKAPSYGWWSDFAKTVGEALKSQTTLVELDESTSELQEMRAFRATLLTSGAAECEDGKIVAVLGNHDSWFHGAARRLLKESQEAGRSTLIR